MKKGATLFFSLLILFVLYGCSSGFSLPESVLKEEPTSPIQLRVITELGAPHYMSSENSELLKALKSTAAWYESQHTSVDIQIETLPISENERAMALEKLRDELKAGTGPDLFLLPCGDLSGPETYLEKHDFYKSIGSYELIKTAKMPALIQDIELAKRDGLFFDISNLYNADSSLNKDELNETVMNAGIFKDKRYVLPLGYSIPMLYLDLKQLESCKIELNDFVIDGEVPVDLLFQATRNTSDLSVAYGTRTLRDFDNLSMFSFLYDYSSTRLELSEEDVYQYFFWLRGYNSGYEPNSDICTVKKYLETEKYFLADGWSLKMAGLGGAAECIGLARYLNIDIGAFPIHPEESGCNAIVTYWGAIGSDCEHPEVAYDFLRLFLLPNVQFGLGFGKNYPTGLEEAAQIGWPVRTKGSVDAMWNQANAGKTIPIKLSDKDIPAINVEIEQVRFPNGLTTIFDIAQSEAVSFSGMSRNIDDIIKPLFSEIQHYMDELSE